MTRSEKRLLTILLSLFVLGGLLIGVTTYQQKRTALLTERQELTGEWLKIEALFEEKEKWELRANWLKQNQPVFTSNKDISESIFNDSMAQNRSGVTIASQTLLPVEETEEYIEAAIAVTASGELAAISRWIYDITSPSSFRTIRNVSITPDIEKPEEIIAQFELLRWYAPPET